MERAFVVGRAALRAGGVLFLGCILSGTMGYGAAPRAPFKFPDSFLWGAATAAHQVEGNNTNNDWWDWEQRGKTRDRSGLACDHWNRYETDFEIAKSLGHNAYRMSVEWSRIEPNQNQFSEEAVVAYRRILEAARARGLKTFVTLHHFTNPMWAAREGSWTNPKMPSWFANFVSYVAPRIGDLVDYWVTVNEPNVTMVGGYVAGLAPPGLQLPLGEAARVLANFMKAHGYAYQIIHEHYPKAMVGFAHHMRVFDAYRWWNPGDQALALAISSFWNYQPLRAMTDGQIRFSIPFMANYVEDFEPLKNSLDFIGINYYTRDLVKLDLSRPEKFQLIAREGAEKNDMGWEIYPEGFYRVLMGAASYGKPIFITENGIADAADSRRAAYLCSHIRQMANAIQDGADIRGYLHWSLLDNFEWVDGFGPRFGLVQMNYATQERTVRASGLRYKEIIESGSLDSACR